MTKQPRKLTKREKIKLLPKALGLKEKAEEQRKLFKKGRSRKEK